MAQTSLIRTTSQHTKAICTPCTPLHSIPTVPAVDAVRNPSLLLMHALLALGRCPGWMLKLVLITTRLLMITAHKSHDCIITRA